MKSINSLRDRGFEGKRDRGNPSGMQGRREEVGQISFSFPSCTQIPPYPLPLGKPAVQAALTAAAWCSGVEPSEL